MHKLTQKHRKDPAGHCEKFEDGVYVCMGSYGNDEKIANQMADAVARRYQYKTRITNRTVRVQGETGAVRKPLYLIWAKVRDI